MGIVRRYACVKQNELTDCGPACLATIVKQYGLEYPISKIRELAGTDRHGTNLKGMIIAGEKLGLEMKAVKGDKEAFLAGFSLPAIAHTLVDGGYLHYVVIWEVGDQFVLIADPAKGIRKLSIDDFFEIWTGRLLLVQKSANFKTGDRRKKVFPLVKKVIKEEKAVFIKLFILSILISLGGIVGSLYYKYLIDRVAIIREYRYLTLVSIAVISIYFFKQAMSFVREKLVILLEKNVEERILMNFYHKLFRLPLNFFSSRQRGDIISRLNDVAKIRDAVSRAAVSVMMDVLLASIAAAFLIYINFTLFLASLGLVALFVVIMLAFKLPMQKMNIDFAEANSRFCSYMIESVDGVETVKSFCYEKNVAEETRNRLGYLWEKLFKLSKLSVEENVLATGIKLIGETVILWFSATKMIAGQITVGDLVLYNVLLGYFTNPVSSLIGLQPTIQTALVALRRIMEVYELSDEANEQKSAVSEPISLKNGICVKDLSFRYGSRELVLDKINISVGTGERIAFVGESGCGKTTLAKLLLNFYHAEMGSIVYGDYDINEIPLSILRDKIAYVPQETFLFRDTIYNNLCMGNENVTKEELDIVCERCRLQEFISKQPRGIESIIDESGANMSGGQKQRLAIARALLKKPDILILDEATSNLDSITEKSIISAIEEVASDVTVIIIAHRLSTIKRCDNIFVFGNHGNISEVGTFDELMEHRGAFYEMWRSQE